jgi:hypothetical protein
MAKNKKLKKILNIFVLDGSGSMNSIKKQIIGGYNELLNSIKQSTTEEFDSRASLFVFESPGLYSENQDYVQTKFSNINISKVKDLTDETYVPGGLTPMYDGIGKAIKDTDKLLGEEIAEVDVIVTVLTDGMENASKDYTGSQVSDLIKEYQDEYGWIFNFIGANVDVEKLAKELNIPEGNTISFEANEEDTAATMDRYTRSVNTYYATSAAGYDAKSVRANSFMVVDEEVTEK